MIKNLATVEDILRGDVVPSAHREGRLRTPASCASAHFRAHRLNERLDMPVYRTIPVEAQPELTLRKWRVFRLSDESIHLLGYNVENDEGRVSSVVESIDRERMVFRTATGRIYQLEGEAGHDRDAAYTWTRWVQINAVDEWTDITDSFVSQTPTGSAEGS